MKKLIGNAIISLLLCIGMTVNAGAYRQKDIIDIIENSEFDVLLKPVETYYSEDFDDISKLSDVAFLDIPDSGMSLSPADAGEDGIGERGNGLLRLDIGAASERVIREINLPLQNEYKVIPNGKKFEFQVDFFKTNPLTNMRFFVLKDSNGRIKQNGLVQLLRDGAPAYADRFHDGPGNLIYGSDSGATNDEKGIIAPEKWYRLNVLWTPGDSDVDNKIEEISVTNLSDNTVVFNVKNIAVTNEIWPLANISEMKMWVATYAGFPEQKIYFDNISIREVEAIDEITSIPIPDEFQEIFEGSYVPSVIAKSLEPLCNDAYARIMNHKITNYADNTLLKEDIRSSDDYSGDNLSYARWFLDTSFILGYMYRTSGKTEYAQRLETQIKQFLSDFSSWPDYPFHDIAESLTALSAAYVWAGEGLTDETKKLVEEAVKKRLDVAITFYEPKYKFIATGWTNQPAVGNSGIAIASITFAKVYPELCSRLLHHSLRAVRLTVASTYPDGATYEGPGYWQYQTQYLAYLFSTLDAVFGDDFGITRVGKFEETGLYHLNMHSSDMKAFNFSDSGDSTPQIMTFYYLAKKFNLPYLSSYADAVCPNGVNYSSWEANSGDIMAMLWRTGTHSGYKDLPLSAHYEGRQSVSVERSGFYPGATYFGIKGGNAMLAHGSIDAGTFVMDSMGERWAEDLSSEDYDGSGYWDFSDTGRWTYYSQRAEGHNTLVINPDSGADQDTSEVALFKDRNTLDFGKMYGENRVIRSFEMKDAGHTIVLTDFVEPDGNADIYWFMHTKKDAEISGNTAILSSGKKRCVAKILSPEGANFTFEDAKPLVIENNKDAKNLDEYKKLQIHFNTSEKTEIKVEFKFENDDFMIENEDGNTIRFNRKIDFSKSTACATDIHGNKIGVSLSEIDEYTLEYDLDVMHPDNTYFVNLSGICDADGNFPSGKTTVSISDNENYDNDIYFNGFDEEFVIDGEPYETVASKKSDGNGRLMIYSSAYAPSKSESTFKTPLLNAESKTVVFECDTMITYNGNEKKLFSLYDSNGNLKCGSLVTLVARSENNDYKHSRISVFGGSLLTDEETGEYFETETGKAYRISAKVDFSLYPAKLKEVSVTDLESGESVSGSYNSSVYISPSFSVGVGQRVWKQDESYFDNLSVHYEREGIDIIEVKNEDTVSVILSNYDKPRILNAFSAVYAGNALKDVKLEKLSTITGINKFEFENISGEGRKVFIWSEECVPYE